ncbi:MAG TPA: tRNA uridine-5-carboxymethylaminomethyl(34) synthesis GTPase MnmE [Dissulfurispiraceae bacterium]|nr:tRNA uridine-5-carboxymethylaminomethyl(34) synthesis GTPase MnmE [Dissulfurispiraceae bacterium]
MHFPDDTIAAISTPQGEGGIGIVRISGPRAIEIADRLFSSPGSVSLHRAASRRILYGFIRDPGTGEPVDEVLVTVMRAPQTYTREDITEINCHGGMVALRRTLALVLNEGARLAEPGEFTKRAFLNGRIDLAQAEAVIDVIRAKTERSEQIALSQLGGMLSLEITALRDRLADLCAHVEACIDFPEEDLEEMTKSGMVTTLDDISLVLTRLSKGYDEGRYFREGVSTAIVGKPNVGKSSLLNALLQRDRAIVTDQPGTTRDVIEEYLNVQGLPLRIMDTAGIRETHDLAESEGVRRSLKAIEGADLVLAVIDAGRPIDDADMELAGRVNGKRTILVVNKTDIESADFNLNAIGRFAGGTIPLPVVRVSALTGSGIETLRDAICERCLSDKGLPDAENALVTNLRHKQSIDAAVRSLEEARVAITGNEPLEVTALLIREALDHLGEIVGAVTTEEILSRIFSDFCIGK